MAVVIIGDTLLGGGLRLLVGTVTMDGSNPTPVALVNYLATVHVGIGTIEGSGALSDDPNQITSAVSGTTLNFYVWKNISGTDPTYVASTESTRLINWMAIGETAVL